MDYYSITMNNITILDCVEDYCYRGNRPIISDGKIEGFVNEGNNDIDRHFYKKYLTMTKYVVIA